MKLADRLLEAQYAEGQLEDLLDAAGVPYEKTGWDSYDCSLEIYGVASDWRMSEELQRALHEAGFARVYVNHLDGWETHYSWAHNKPFVAVRGWRRRWVADPKAKTTRSIGEPVSPENAGYYEISWWPESWKMKDWLKSKYMRIVPDPLQS